MGAKQSGEHWMTFLLVLVIGILLIGINVAILMRLHDLQLSLKEDTNSLNKIVSGDSDRQVSNTRVTG